MAFLGMKSIPAMVIDNAKMFLRDTGWATEMFFTSVVVQSRHVSSKRT